MSNGQEPPSLSETEGCLFSPSPSAPYQGTINIQLTLGDIFVTIKKITQWNVVNTFLIGEINLIINS